MPFVQVVHWKPAEAEALMALCRVAGFEAECCPDPAGPAITRWLRARLPDAIVIDLTRLPSHGRELGAWLRETKKTRHIPLIYVDGDAEKVERIQSLLPDAVFTQRSRLRSALKSALRKGAQNAAVPPPAIVRFGERTAAQKIGIKPGMKIEFLEEPAKPQDVTLWFIHDFDGLMSALNRMRRLAPHTRMWMVWRKGARRDVTFHSIVTAGAEVGLALSKLCAVDAVWSAVWLVRCACCRRLPGDAPHRHHKVRRPFAALRRAAYQIDIERSKMPASSSGPAGRGESFVTRCWGNVPCTSAGMSSEP